MKRKQLVILIGLVVIAGAVSFFMHMRTSARWTRSGIASTGALVLPDLDVNAVSAIVIKDAREELTMTKSDGKWTVTQANGYPADFQRIRTLLLDLKELKITQSVPGANDFLERLNLLEPTGEKIASGILLQLKDTSGHPIYSIILGKAHIKKGPGNMPFGGNWPDGKYVRVKESGLIGLVSSTFSSVTTEKSRWCSRDFIEVGEKSSVVVLENGQELWRLDKKNGTLTLAGDVPEGKVVDSSAVSSVTGALAHASFADIATGDAADFSPVKTCQLVDTEGIQYDLMIGEKKKDQYPLRVAVRYVGPEQRIAGNDESEEEAKKADEAFAAKLAATKDNVATLGKRLEGWTYMVGTYTLAPLDKSRNEFFRDKPAPPEK